MAPSPPPLTGIRVLELAGLAPAPYAGMLLADYGASVLRIDRPNTNTSSDQLTRRKAAIAIDLKQPHGRNALLALARHADVLIDPFRPGVLESLGLGPDVLRRQNQRLIVARMTGFRRDGKYSAMAGHDINYLAVSGVLSQLGRKGEPPYAPGNILGDFAGGGLVLFTGIVMALLHRTSTGQGQVVEANMVDGSAHLGSFLRFATKTMMWDRPRGENVLDGGCPWYDTYVTRDGKYMAVGALEPQFFAALIKGLGLDESWNQRRYDRETWPTLKLEIEARFVSLDRADWEKVFDGTDACCTPVLDLVELQAGGHDQRPLVTIKESPSLALAAEQGQDDVARGQGQGVQGAGWTGTTLHADSRGEEQLRSWTGWERGAQYNIVDGCVVVEQPTKSKL